MTSSAGQNAGRVRNRHNPYKRAIAHAIMLEQAWDRLAVFSPSGPPPFQRIVPQGAKIRHRVRMVLPRPLDDQALRRLHDERTAAIRELHEKLSPTLGYEESASIQSLLEESCNAREAEQYHAVIRRRRAHSIDTEPLVEDDVHKAISREADRPLSPSVERTERGPRGTTRPVESFHRDSISIDLVVHSLIEWSGSDRDRLHREIAETRRTLPNPNAVVELHSPARRSNTGRTLHSLGQSFPPASFRLVGLALDVTRIDLDPIRPDDTAWRYAMTAGRHVFMTARRPPQLRSWDLPGRSLAAVLGDERWHPSLVVDSAVEGAGPMLVERSNGLVVTFVPSRTHIDPPGSAAPIIHDTYAGANAVRLGEQRKDHWRHLDAVPLIERTLERLGQRQARRIDAKEGFGLELRLAAPTGGPIMHRHPIRTETLDDGNDAIVARVEDIVSKILKHHRRRGRRPGATDPVDRAPFDQGDGPRQEQDRGALMKDRPDPAILLGPDGASMLDTAQRIDALLHDLLWNDPCGVEPELHMQEELLCIASATIGDGMRYRLERFDRTLGRITHAIGTVEVDKSLTASMIERLRDGTIGLLVDTWPEFAQSQVRRVGRDEITTIVTIRVPLIDAKTNP